MYVHEHKAACCVRCGGNWKRDYGDSYTGTQGETPDTAKEPPTDYRASSRPYHPTATLAFLAHRAGVLPSRVLTVPA